MNTLYKLVEKCDSKSVNKLINASIAYDDLINSPLSSKQKMLCQHLKHVVVGFDETNIFGQTALEFMCDFNYVLDALNIIKSGKSKISRPSQKLSVLYYASAHRIQPSIILALLATGKTNPSHIDHEYTTLMNMCV